MRARGIVVLASIAALSASVLTACSSSGDAESSSPAAESSSATPTPSPSPSLVGGDPATWTPVSITEADNGDKIKLVVRQFATFTDLPAVNADNHIVLRAKKKGIVDIHQPTATTNAGFQAIKKGKTRVTVWDGKPKKKSSHKIMYVVVKVKKKAPDAQGTPST